MAADILTNHGIQDFSPSKAELEARRAADEADAKAAAAAKVRVRVRHLFNCRLALILPSIQKIEELALGAEQEPLPQLVLFSEWAPLVEVVLD